MHRYFKIILFLSLIIIIAFVILRFKNSELETKRSTFVKSIHFNSLKEFYPETEKAGQVIQHKSFTLQYNEKAEQANWVLYLLTSQMIDNKTVKRSDKFTSDPAVETGSAIPADYRRSGYDKGHLCPAADMAWDKTANQETFYMSNMSPQIPGFNRGIWKVLEEKVRTWADANDSLIIITGPVLNKINETIGTDHVAVPVAYYKIIADISYPTYKTIAFLMPNAESNASVFHFSVSIDSIENLVQFNVFQNFPELEQTEGKIDTLEWQK